MLPVLPSPEKVVASEALDGVPILVLANKQDVEVSPTQLPRSPCVPTARRVVYVYPHAESATSAWVCRAPCPLCSGPPASRTQFFSECHLELLSLGQTRPCWRHAHQDVGEGEGAPQRHIPSVWVSFPHGG